MNLRTVRSGGYAGIAFLAIIVISVFITGLTPPDNSASAAVIAAYNDAHRVGILVSGWLGIPAVALFLWFATGLYRWQSRSADDEGLALFALINGVVATALAFVGSVLQIGLVFHPSSVLGPQLVVGLYDLFAISSALVWGGSAFFFFGASLSGARHQTLPAWCCTIGYLASLGLLAASLTAMYKSGPMMLGGMAPLFLGVIPFVVAVACFAGVMIARAPRA